MSQESDLVGKPYPFGATLLLLLGVLLNPFEQKDQTIDGSAADQIRSSVTLQQGRRNTRRRSREKCKQFIIQRDYLLDFDALNPKVLEHDVKESLQLL